MISAMRIESVKQEPDRAGRYWICLEDGTRLALYRQTVEDFALYPGKELTEDDWKSLQESAGEMSAKMRAVRIVAASSVSKKDLQQRLVQKGENPQQARDAVQWMADMQLVDDRKTAEQVVHRCIQKGYGLARAKQALYEKRIPKEYWDEVLAEYPDQTDTVAAFLRSKLGQNWEQNDLRKAIDAAMRRGHSYGTVRRALEQLPVDTDEFPEE